MRATASQDLDWRAMHWLAGPTEQEGWNDQRQAARTPLS